MIKQFHIFLLLLFFLPMRNSIGAQQSNRKDQPVYIDAKSAGTDFLDQGEYSGASPTDLPRKMGAQVIALGDGRFQAVILPGGLPGDGWDGKTRIELNGRREGKSIRFKSTSQQAAYSAYLSGNQKLDVVSPEGQSFNLARIERKSPDAGMKPPAGATVLFDGSNTDSWQNGKMDDRHLLIDGARTKKKYQNFTMHVEFILPFKPFAKDQERGNSGIYIQDRYEVQILDTFGHPAEFNGCGSMYRQHSPSINMCYPPLQWQTYDIDFRAAQFDDSGKKIKNAMIALKHNGALVQDHYELTNKTGAGKPEGAAPGPIYLQDHHNPVFFRNVWIIEK